MVKPKYTNEIIEDDSYISVNTTNTEQVEYKAPEEMFQAKELCHYKIIDRFFKKCSDENINKMIDIIHEKSDISLRILEWYVTKYTKKKTSKKDSKIETFDIKLSYKIQLRSYKKRYFDPFRRGQKFFYYFGNKENGKYIHTTLGQLNFFKWLFSNNILEDFIKNKKQITSEFSVTKKCDDTPKKKRKTKEQTSSSSKNASCSEESDDKSVNMKATKDIDSDGKVKIILRFN